MVDTIQIYPHVKSNKSFAKLHKFGQLSKRKGQPLSDDEDATAKAEKEKEKLQKWKDDLNANKNGEGEE